MSRDVKMTRMMTNDNDTGNDTVGDMENDDDKRPITK
jgi:hypothetical protein